MKPGGDRERFRLMVTRITRWASIVSIAALILGEAMAFFEVMLSSMLFRLGIGLVMITPMIVLMSAFVYFYRLKNNTQMYLVLIISMLLFMGPLVLYFSK